MQIHKRFTAEQVKVLLKGYCQGTLDRAATEETLEISRPRFFALLTDIPALKPTSQIGPCS